MYFWCFKIFEKLFCCGNVSVWCYIIWPLIKSTCCTICEIQQREDESNILYLEYLVFISCTDQITLSNWTGRREYITQSDRISNSWTPGTEAKASSGWRWIWVLVGLLAVFQVTAPPGEGAASSRATDAPLFLQRLFKGLIDRLGGMYGGGLQLGEAGLSGGWSVFSAVECTVD